MPYILKQSFFPVSHDLLVMTCYQGIKLREKRGMTVKLFNLNTPPPSLLAQNICCRVGKSKGLELLRTFNLCKKFSMDIIVYRWILDYPSLIPYPEIWWFILPTQIITSTQQMSRIPTRAVHIFRSHSERMNGGHNIVPGALYDLSVRGGGAI